MSTELIVILDDRTPPSASVRAALGEVRFSDILRRRRTMRAELTDLAQDAGAEAVVHLSDDEQRDALVARIRDAGEGVLYLRLPLCLPPTQAEPLRVLIQKARYALGTMLASQLRDDEAAAVLTGPDAIAVLTAPTPEARRAILLGMRDAQASITDHAQFIDIRQSRGLMYYLSGATELRQFNAAHLDGTVFHKQSADVAKMRAEHGYFHVAPPELKRFLLPTFGFWEKGDQAGYQMEHLAIPDAALQWVHHAFTPADFDALLAQMFDFLGTRPAAQPAPDMARAQILDKLTTRMERFLTLPQGQSLNALLAASGPQGDLPQMMARAVPLIGRALQRTQHLPQVFSHGDPCFSNVLYDRRIGLMRLIDPRGAVAFDDALMHPLYDLAKISHSVLGGYDFVNNGLHRACLDRDLKLRLDWTTQGPPDWAGSAFRAHVDKVGYDIKDVRAIELSLFLSMLPLHSDHPDKLLGFALIAGRILEDLE
ncbi:hypothetical protein [Tropicibacter naphthalenivorans]|uniref:Phosphotransferase enzyme family protein n=1 Tax=Tropicibacter naphthalenivorans TaxID=441103 RepID=A0A0P1GDR7_9RHOB|nr:hypothetical protein [Tropicibacter naphthalenivorans]CUH79476.1 hypothetical protein TRN7648_02492 [Tropicibacter naphthalenivorans]SMC72868.1 hypothetical protein SAMN04488093_103121 [Tropicibacter naphthalenivorans]